MGLSYDTTPIQPIDRSGLLHSLLALIQNPDEFGKRLAELEKVRADANAALALVGPADEITELRQAAAALLEEAQADRAAAQDEGDKLVADAEAVAKKVRDESVLYRREAEEMREKAEIDAKATYKRARFRAAEIAAMSDSSQAEQRERASALDDRESAVRVREEAAAAAQAKADAARAEYEEKLAGFRRIAGG